MAILPYMHQLPQDFYRNNYPTPVVEVIAPVEEVLETVPTEPSLGTPIPPPTGGGIPEAPNDGGTYARQSVAWTSQWDGGSY